jgi:single-strand DNA-binding protein
MLKISVIGNIGSDCIVSSYQEKKVINFTLAATVGAGTSKERTAWIDCAIWSREGLAPFLLKGVKIYAEGAPDLKTWVNRDGEAKGVIKLTIDNITLLNSKQQTADPEPPQQTEKTIITPREIDDLPF